LTPVQVADELLRKILTDAVEKIEGFVEQGKVTLQKPLNEKHPHGMCTTIVADRTADDKPLIVTFTYKMDPVKLKMWLEEHKYMLYETAPLVFTGTTGIEMIYNEGTPDKFMKAMFGILNEHGEKDRLRLFDEEVQFVVHRQVFDPKQWTVIRVS
jgi:hypothetical protein